MIVDPGTSTGREKDTFYSPINYTFYKRQPYQSLNKIGKGVRLLQVTQAQLGAERVFTLMDEVPLAGARNTYTAISYCAGDPFKTQSLLVNGIRFNAFANLGHAIDETCDYLSLKHGTLSHLLWVDQICINQSDSSERSHQVGFMYDIYENAREVAICLSVERCPHYALPWIRSLDIHKVLDEGRTHTNGRYYKDNPLRTLESDQRRVEHVVSHKDYFSGTYISSVKEKIRHQIGNTTSCNGLLDVVNMLKQPWWTRAWIVQELVASRQATFIYGGYSVSCDLLSEAVFAIASLKDDIRNNVFGIQLLRHHWTFAASTATSVLKLKKPDVIEREIKETLNHSRQCQASDKRDHV